MLDCAFSQCGSGRRYLLGRVILRSQKQPFLRDLQNSFSEKFSKNVMKNICTGVSF